MIAGDVSEINLFPTHVQSFWDDFQEAIIQTDASKTTLPGLGLYAGKTGGDNDIIKKGA